MSASNQATALGMSFSAGYLTLWLNWIPIAATFAVSNAQAVNTKVLWEGLLLVPSTFCTFFDSDLAQDNKITLSYIEDMNVFGTNPLSDNFDRSQAADSFAIVSRHTEGTKSTTAGASYYNFTILLICWRNILFTINAGHALNYSELPDR